MNPLTTSPPSPLPRLQRVLADHLLRPVATILSTRLCARLLTRELLYWHGERLYWEGVTHPDGGDHEEEAEIHAAEGAQSACYRLADRLRIARAALPDAATAEALARARMRADLDRKESRALRTLATLGPSRDISVRDHPREWAEAADAEAELDRCDRVREYLDWLTASQRPDAKPGEKEAACEA